MAVRKTRDSVLLINPPFVVDAHFIDYPYFTGLGVLSNAAVLRAAGMSVAVADAHALPVSDAYPLDNGRLLTGCTPQRLMDSVEGRDFSAVVVGMSPFFAPHLRQDTNELLLEQIRLRFRNARIVAADCLVGGMHYIEYEAADFLNYYPQVDAVVKYECEKRLAGAIHSSQKGEITLCRSADVNPDELPFPAWDLISIKHYHGFLKRFFLSTGRKRLFRDVPTLPAVSSRGCAYRCTFCTSNPGRGKAGFRPHTPEYMERYLHELKKKHGAAQVVLLDGCANSDPARFDAILGIFKRLKLLCAVPNGLRADKLTKKTLRAFREAADSLAVSAESADASVLKQSIGKGMNIESVERVAAWCRELSLPLQIHYIIGYPGETIETMNRTLHHAARMKEVFGAEPLVQPLVPIHGSAAHRMCADRGLLNGFDQRKLYDYFHAGPPLNTPEFTADDTAFLMRQFRRRQSAPVLNKVIINLTYKCSNDCRFCAVGDRTREHGDLKRFHEYLRQCRRNGVTAVDFDGGEPTLYPNLIPLIGFARQLGYDRITVTTNGRALADRGFTSSLLLSGITDLLISIHGHNDKLHDYHTRSSGSFDETARGMAMAVRLKPRRLALAANTMLTDKNAPCISDLMEFVHGLGIDKLNVQFLTPFGNARNFQYRNIKAVCGHLSHAMKTWRDKMSIELVNTVPCQIESFIPGYEPEVGKLSRMMVFADAPGMNLSKYLDQRRCKKPECNACKFSIVCAGFYEFSGNSGGGEQS